MNQIVENPEKMISAKKIDIIMRFYQDNKDHVFQMKKSRNLYETYILLVQWVMMTVRLLIRIKVINNGKLESDNQEGATDMRKTLFETRKQLDQGDRKGERKFHKQLYMRM